MVGKSLSFIILSLPYLTIAMDTNSDSVQRGTKKDNGLSASPKSLDLIHTTSPDNILYIEIEPTTNKITCFHAITKKPLQNLSLILQSQLTDYCKKLYSLIKKPITIEHCTITRNSNALIITCNDYSCIALWCGHDEEGNIRMNTDSNCYPVANPQYGVCYDPKAHIKNCQISPNGLFAAYQDENDNWDMVQLLNHSKDEQDDRIASYEHLSSIQFSPTDWYYVCHDQLTNVYMLYAIMEDSTNQCITKLPASVHCFFTPEGNNLITIDKTDKAHLWNIKDGAEVAQLPNIGKTIDLLLCESEILTLDIEAENNTVTAIAPNGNKRIRKIDF